MTAYERYQQEVAALAALSADKDYSAAGDAAYYTQYLRTKRAYWAAASTLQEQVIEIEGEAQ